MRETFQKMNPETKAAWLEALRSGRYKQGRGRLPKLKPEVKKAWVAALRSGKYKQGRQYLRNDQDEYCCLGVLCDLGARREERWKLEGSFWAYGGRTDAPPPDVREAAGLLAGWSEIHPIPILMELNDLRRLSFNEIADFIEEEL